MAAALLPQCTQNYLSKLSQKADTKGPYPCVILNKIRPDSFDRCLVFIMTQGYGPFVLFEEGEEDGDDQEDEGDKVVPVQGLGLEAEGQDEREHYQRDALLNHLKLNQIERAAGNIGSDAVGRNHNAILKESQSPRGQNNKNKRPVCTDFHLLEFKVSIPRECHQDI